MTREEYDAKMVALEPLTEEQRKSVTCSLLVHSHITEGCLGEIFCARCGEQVGDYFLRGYYDPLEVRVLLPCWRCGGESELQEIHTGGKPVYAVSCKKHHCGAYGCAHQTKKNAVAYWNTRAPILSEREMEMLEGLE